MSETSAETKPEGEKVEGEAHLLAPADPWLSTVVVLYRDVDGQRFARLQCDGSAVTLRDAEMATLEELLKRFPRRPF